MPNRPSDSPCYHHCCSPEEEAAAGTAWAAVAAADSSLGRRQEDRRVDRSPAEEEGSHSLGEDRRRVEAAEGTLHRHLGSNRWPTWCMWSVAVCAVGVVPVVQLSFSKTAVGWMKIKVREQAEEG